MEVNNNHKRNNIRIESTQQNNNRNQIKSEIEVELNNEELKMKIRRYLPSHDKVSNNEKFYSKGDRKIKTNQVCDTKIEYQKNNKRFFPSLKNVTFNSVERSSKKVKDQKS